MSEPALDPRDEAVLGELLELGLAAVRHVQGRLLEAEDGKAVAELSLALGRATRSLRQTLALKAKLKRERLRQAKEAFEQAEAAETAQVERRKAQVETAVTRLIWSEYEHAESLELLEGLEHHLAAETADEGFPATPVPAVIARICDALGIDPPSPPPQGVGDRQAVAGASAADSPSGTAPPAGEQPGLAAISSPAGGGGPRSGGGGSAAAAPREDPLSPSATARPDGEQPGLAAPPPPSRATSSG